MKLCILILIVVVLTALALVPVSQAGFSWCGGPCVDGMVA